jgi:Glycosyl hydrolases family 43
VIPLAADRIHAAGGRRSLFSATRTWEAGVVEGPWAIRRNSRYYLFYSGGSVGDASYAMGYATALSPTGTFTRASANPILKSTADVIGPGGGSVTTSPSGADWILYHGRAIAGGPRTLRIDPLAWSASLVTVHHDAAAGAIVRGAGAARYRGRGRGPSPPPSAHGARTGARRAAAWCDRPSSGPVRSGSEPPPRRPDPGSGAGRR